MQEVVQFASGAVCSLAARAHVGVVADDDRVSESVAQLVDGCEPDPIGQDGGGADDVGPDVQRSGDAGGDTEHVGHGVSALFEGLAGERSGDVEGVTGLVVDVEVFPALGEHLTGGGGCGDGDVGVAQVDAHDDAGRGRQAQQGGPPAAAAGAAGWGGVLGEQASGEQGGDAVADRAGDSPVCRLKSARVGAVCSATTLSSCSRVRRRRADTDA